MNDAQFNSFIFSTNSFVGTNKQSWMSTVGVGSLYCSQMLETSHQIYSQAPSPHNPYGLYIYTAAAHIILQL